MQRAKSTGGFLDRRVTIDLANRYLPEFASMPTKQWIQVEVCNEIVMHLLLSFISNSKPRY